jgi:hypothetical protein
MLQEDRHHRIRGRHRLVRACGIPSHLLWGQNVGRLLHREGLLGFDRVLHCCQRVLWEQRETWELLVCWEWRVELAPAWRGSVSDPCVQRRQQQHPLYLGLRRAYSPLVVAESASPPEQVTEKGQPG